MNEFSSLRPTLNACEEFVTVIAFADIGSTVQYRLNESLKSATC